MWCEGARGMPYVLSSPVVSLLLFEMIGFSFEPVGTCTIGYRK